MNVIIPVMVGAVVVVSAVMAATVPAAHAAAPVSLPVERYFENQTLKGFDVLVDRAYHERHRDLFPHNGHRNQFTGLHAGADVEFYSGRDARREIPVRAIAAGEVIHVGTVPGYGGLVVIRHREPEVVTSLYGHVRLSDVRVRTGQRVTAGQTVAFLGESFSAETSGARKHLHFGIHKGPALDFDGYEQTREHLLAEWYNPDDWLVRHGAVRDPRLTAATPTPDPTPPPVLKVGTAPEDNKDTSWLSRFIDWFRDRLA
ncbi:MAG: M23 family metallopeptidase [bacterium]|nr:M23 family metallopeptidase [bacterium]